MKEEIQEEFSDEQQEVLKSVRMSRVMIPILIGLAVVGVMFWRQMTPERWERLLLLWQENKGHIIFWVSISFTFLVIRHIAYATRLRILSEKAFSWKKCIELIFIWEFSSAVTPTSVGGSAVALFALAQEKLSTAKTTTIVLYSAVLDTIFFLFTLPILFVILGPIIIRPNMNTFWDMDGWSYTFLGAYGMMLFYGSIFFYGLFINAKPMRRLLLWFTKFGWLKKLRPKAEELGRDLITASQEMRKKKITFHLGAFLATATAWSCRFLLLNCLIIAFVLETQMDFFSQFGLYSRLEAMFVVIAFLPSPGGAGFAELTLFGFTSDFIPNKEMATIIALIWRLFTYYLYLFIGVIIIPNWIKNLLNDRKKSKKTA